MSIQKRKQGIDSPLQTRTMWMQAILCSPGICWILTRLNDDWPKSKSPILIARVDGVSTECLTAQDSTVLTEAGASQSPSPCPCGFSVEIQILWHHLSSQLETPPLWIPEHWVGLEAWLRPACSHHGYCHTSHRQGYPISDDEGDRKPRYWSCPDPG